MTKNTVKISAIYPNTGSAVRAAEALQTLGINNSRMILIEGEEELEPISTEYKPSHREEIDQVAQDGLTKGAAIGTFGGFLIGLGIVTLPVAPVLALAGMASSVGTGAVLGGLTGGLFESLAEITTPEGTNPEELERVLLVAEVRADKLQEAEQMLSEGGAIAPEECLS